MCGFIGRCSRNGVVDPAALFLWVTWAGPTAKSGRDFLPEFRIESSHGNRLDLLDEKLRNKLTCFPPCAKSYVVCCGCACWARAGLLLIHATIRRKQPSAVRKMSRPRKKLRPRRANLHPSRRHPSRRLLRNLRLQVRHRLPLLRSLLLQPHRQTSSPSKKGPVALDNDLVKRYKERFAIHPRSLDRPQASILVVAREKLVEIATYKPGRREMTGSAISQLVDWPKREQRFDIVLNMYRWKKK